MYRNCFGYFYCLLHIDWFGLNWKPNKYGSANNSMKRAYIRESILLCENYSGKCTIFLTNFPLRKTQIYKFTKKEKNLGILLFYENHEEKKTIPIEILSTLLQFKTNITFYIGTGNINFIADFIYFLYFYCFCQFYIHFTLTINNVSTGK